MNILFYCPFKFNLKSKNISSLGGIETLNVDLSKELIKRKFNIYLATFCKKKIIKNGVINIPIDIIKRNNHNYNFDVIISSNDAKIFDFYKNSKKILWMHNTLSLEKAFRKKKLFSILKNKITAVFVSNYLNKKTSKLYSFNNREVISNFLSPFFFPKKINYNRKKIFVWSVQRNKGLANVIDLWIKKIFPINKDAKLFIFGIDLKEVSLKKKFFQKYNIFFYGRVSKNKLKSIYTKSLAMICLGYDETFCLNAIEANSCGLPIITFGKTALKEFTLHNKNGFLINNFNDLENRILNLSTSKVNKNIVNYCYNNSKKFNLQKIISQWLKVIKI